MRVAILLGSVRKGRKSHAVAYYLEEMLEARQVNVDLIDLDREPLPIFEEQPARHPDPPQSVLEIGRRLEAADALLMVTPEYHGSISGVLKNAIDYYRPEFERKPIGVVTTSTGAFGGINASTHLQQIILGVWAYPMPLKLLVPHIHEAFDEQMQPLRPDVTQTTKRFLDEFLWFADAICRKKQEPLEEEPV